MDSTEMPSLVDLTAEYVADSGGFETCVVVETARQTE